MKEISKKSLSSTEVSAKQSAKNLPFEDDRYPGSFFRVPGVPQPGNTSWNITKIK